MTAASGVALATFDRTGSLLDAWFPAPRLGRPDAPAAADPGERRDELRGVVERRVAVAIEDLSAPPDGPLDGWLRLHLLSHRLVEPNSLSLGGLMPQLPVVAWTSRGPVPAGELDRVRAACREAGRSLHVHALDRFPPMLDYVTPPGVRVADGARVRLGAHLAPGTTVMPAGFVNYNAGTLGPSMVEGRISAGVVVGAGTDIGGGASIMGTLSGGGRERVRLGERCLLGANAGVGISLGDGCVVEAGCYVTAGTKVSVGGEVRPARELSGKPGLQYWRNSQTGRVEARPVTARWAGLNADLHLPAGAADPGARQTRGDRGLGRGSSGRTGGAGA